MEEALDLSFDRLLMMIMMYFTIYTLHIARFEVSSRDAAPRFSRWCDITSGKSLIFTQFVHQAVNSA